VGYHSTRPSLLNSNRSLRWPGALDVTVGGGIGIGDSPRETIIRECVEEASLPTTYVQAHARFVGYLPYPNRKASGWLLPGYYYLFDMRLPSDGSVQPRLNPVDGEVDSFQVMGIEEVQLALLQGKFKASSALALIKFLIRHGIVKDSDPDFVMVCREIERDCM
jgi:8-oxo-dGTP pyrophosphatase MutT (NUDIX family)